jgi:hypothetical protein
MTATPNFTSLDSDTYNNWVLENATYYGVSLFLGRGEHDSYTCRTLDEARSVGAQMVAYHKNGRKPLIYAFTPEGRHALVPDNA